MMHCEIFKTPSATLIWEASPALDSRGGRKKLCHQQIGDKQLESKGADELPKTQSPDGSFTLRPALAEHAQEFHLNMGVCLCAYKCSMYTAKL